MSIDRNSPITDYAWCFENPELAASTIDSLTAQLKIVRDELEELKKQELVGYFLYDDYRGHSEIDAAHKDNIDIKDDVIALYARPVPAIPDGMALLPIEPTPEQQYAGMKALLNCDQDAFEEMQYYDKHDANIESVKIYASMIEEYLKCNKQQAK